MSIEAGEPSTKVKRSVVHDIRNQLSSISLSIDQLKYEITEQTDDCQFYFNTINDACKKINVLLSDL